MAESQFVRNQDPSAEGAEDTNQLAKKKAVAAHSMIVEQLYVEPDSFHAAESFNDRRVEVPPPIATPHGVEPTLDVVAPAVVEVAAPMPVEEKPAPVVVAKVQPEMDFPARLIHLKIENDKVRAKLNELEKLMNAGI